jgi:hypothetical protein
MTAHVLIAALVLLGTQGATADIVSAVALPPQHCIDGARGPVCLHLFESQSVEIPLSDELVSKTPQKIQAQLLQVTRRLVAPHGPVIAICDGNCAKLRAFPLSLPAVKRETEWLVQIYYAAEPGVWQPANPVALMLYPRSMLDPLRHWAKRNSLVVTDRAGLLRTFLKDRRIPFVQRALLRNDPSGRQVLQMAVGEASDQAMEAAQTPVHWILFTERVKTLPRITVWKHGRERKVQVEMTLIEKLDDNPLTQKIFMEIFQTAIDSGNEVTS